VALCNSHLFVIFHLWCVFRCSSIGGLRCAFKQRYLRGLYLEVLGFAEVNKVHMVSKDGKATIDGSFYFKCKFVPCLLRREEHGWSALDSARCHG